MEANFYSKEDIINLAKMIPLPKTQDHLNTSYYGGQAYNSLSRTTNLRESKIATHNNVYYLQVFLLDYHEKGPCDIPYMEITDELYFKFVNGSWIKIDKFKIADIYQDLIWEDIIID